MLFSSTTARFGRTGQVAYAAANEVLNKTAQAEARRRPGCRVVAVNWGPWDGGMVTPGLRKVFEAEGVGLIPLADGAAFLVQELTAAGQAVEVVALGKPRGRRVRGRSRPRGRGGRPPPAPAPAPVPPTADPAAGRRPGAGVRADRGRRRRTRSCGRTCSTAGRCCRWPCTWSGWPTPPCTATPGWCSTGSTTCGSPTG